MHQIPVYRDQIQAIVNEINRNKGANLRIVGNTVYFTDKEGKDLMFVPELADNVPVFIKKEAVAPEPRIIPA
jgi:hypothetical protein